MGRPLKGTRPASDPTLTPDFWQGLTGNPEPSQRDQFLWLSIDRIRHFGLSQFTTTHVAKRLGYSVAMINHHFGSRDGLVAEGAATVHAEYSAKLIDAAESAPSDPRRRLEAYIRARITEGRALGGWNQVLNFPAHSFESPAIAMERAGQGFTDSFNNNLRYMTQLVLDYQRGTVSRSTFESKNFPFDIVASNPDVFVHASHIGTTTAGIVMWLSGRIDAGVHPAKLHEMANGVVTKIVDELVRAIPVD